MRTTRWTLPVGGESDLQALERHPYEELVPARSIYEVLQATATLHGDRPAATSLASASPDSVVRSLTHRAFLGEVTKAANLFAAASSRAEPTVAFIGRNYLQLPEIIWGAETAGVVGCLNYLLTAEAITELLQAMKADILVMPGPAVDREIFDKMRPILDRMPGIETVFVLGGPPDGNAGSRLVDFARAAAACRHDALDNPLPPDRNRMAAIFHTGGTTGLPKLVPQTHGNQIHAAWSFAQMFRIDESDAIINGMPIFHVGGTMTFHMSVLAAGGHVVFTAPAGFRDPEVVRNYWATVARFRTTMAGGVPTTIASMADTPVEGHDISSLRMALTGGAILPSAVAKRFEERVGVPLLEQYGMTETVATIATTPFLGEHLRGSVGLRGAFAGIRIAARTPDDGVTDAPPGTVGLVTVRGPNVIAGYLHERHNKGLFAPGGWMSTGDLGYLTPCGQLVLTGRHKDLIIRSGHNIDPASIEEVANAHPAVRLSAAVGMPDAYAGEVPVIYVSPLEGKTLDPEEVKSFITARVQEPVAKPRHVFVIDAIPTTGVGKIFKPALRQMAIRHKIMESVAQIDAAAAMPELDIDMDGPKGPSAIIRFRDDAQRAALEAPLRTALTDLPLELRFE